MPAQQSGPRHAAPRDPARTRAAILTGVLLAAAGVAFAGLTLTPAAAGASPHVVVADADASAPLKIASVVAADLTPPATANRELAGALALGLAEANKPPPPPPAPERASRDREAPEQSTGTGASFARPGDGRLTSSFGRRWGRLHAGIDLAAGTGSPIRAAAAGTVTASGSEGGYGRAGRILHPDGTVTVYAHLSAITVSEGERVEAGEQIGREGNTGNSTGPHLHFEVRIDGSPVDPASWLRQRDVDV